MSVVESIQAKIQVARAEQKVNCSPEAAREFALAITHLEDAAMRMHRGLLMKSGAIPGTVLPDVPEEGAEAKAETDKNVSKKPYIHPGQTTVDEMLGGA